MIYLIIVLAFVAGIVAVAVGAMLSILADEMRAEVPPTKNLGVAPLVACVAVLAVLAVAIILLIPHCCG